jgi:hypothetical protein
MTLRERVNTYGDTPIKKPKGVTQEQWEKALNLYKTSKSRGDKFPELTVAQAALETGWFKHPSGEYNYFGQKATKSQRGSTKSTKEVEGDQAYSTKARFRDYTSLEEAVDDRIKKWGSKYQDANTVGEALYSIWSYDEKAGRGRGYATDNKYDVKIKKILGMIGVPTNQTSSVSQQPVSKQPNQFMETRPTVARDATMVRTPRLATSPINNVTREELLQFDKIQSIESDNRKKEEALLKHYEALSTEVETESNLETEKDLYYGVEPDMFDPYNYISLQEGGSFVGPLQESLTDQAKKYGELKLSGDIQVVDSEQVDVSKKRMRDYYNSEGFMRILKKQYTDKEATDIKNERLRILEDMPVNVVNSIGKKPRYISGLSVHNEKDHRVEEMWDKKHNHDASTHPTKEGVYLENVGYKGIPEHEISHFTTRNGAALSDKDFKEISNRVTDPNLEIHQKGPYPRKNKITNKPMGYLDDPTEAQARIVTTRLLLKHNNIHDYNKGEFTQEHLEKLKTDIKKNPNRYGVQDFIDLLESTNSDDDLIYLLNNIASLDEKNNDHIV